MSSAKGTRRGRGVTRGVSGIMNYGYQSNEVPNCDVLNFVKENLNKI